jgi:hypothetical protein
MGDGLCKINLQCEVVYYSTGKSVSVFQRQHYHRRKKHPALPITGERAAQASSVSEADCVWRGVPCNVDPRKIEPAPELLEVWYQN